MIFHVNMFRLFLLRRGLFFQTSPVVADENRDVIVRILLRAARLNMPSFSVWDGGRR